MNLLLYPVVSQEATGLFHLLPVYGIPTEKNHMTPHNESRFTVRNIYKRCY